MVRCRCRQDAAAAGRASHEGNALRLVRYLPGSIAAVLAKPWSHWQDRRRARSPFWTTYGAGIPLALLEGRIVINHRRRFIYFRVPKAATSTVMASLYASDTGKVIQSGGIWHNTSRYYAHPSQLTAAEVERLADYTAFATVRHPVKRLHSAYRNKIINKKPPSRQVFKALGRDPATSEISFEEFIGYLENGGLMSDPHWLPQRFFLPLGFRPLDEIGRVESLSEDLPRILGRLYPDGFKLTEYRRNATGADAVEMDPLLAERIARLYAEDFAILGYPR